MRSDASNHEAAAAAAILGGSIVLALSCGRLGQQRGPTAAARYPHAAPLSEYRETSAAAEIALARSAAPPSISAHAAVLVLGDSGYTTAVPGTNGFVCFVERSWAADVNEPEFWNPKVRGPNCFNAIAARTELPQYLARTHWVLAGAGRQEIIARTRAAFANHTFRNPEPGALSYMLSRGGYLNDDAAGPWLPHLMFFVPHGDTAGWGAGSAGSPIIRADGSDIESTVLLVPVLQWSDGSPAQPPAMEPPK
ncbi:MAG TPA: hypothetical protein VHB25_19320 [Gemmatimonadaceae bacterium]|nr:hypothetical protein [Gemmatimonadaceae bacterium]